MVRALSHLALFAAVVVAGLACQRPETSSPANPAPTTAVTSTTAPVGTAHLTVHIADLRNRTGHLVFGVFRSADGFPNDRAKAVNWQVRPAADGDTFTVDLPPGTYAASVLHDENDNGRIDKNLLGIPTEGYGVTNNPKPRRRAARFDEATFTLPAAGADLTISVQYSFL